MITKRIYTLLLLGLLSFCGVSQDLAYNDFKEKSFANARQFAYEGNHKSAIEILNEVLSENPNNLIARSLLGRTYSWNGQYDKARKEFNIVTSKERNNKDVWISAVKNELYAKNNDIALGLANKALFYLKNNPEIERLREMALNNIKNQKYPESIWYSQETNIKSRNEVITESKPAVSLSDKIEGSEEESSDVKRKTPADKDELSNRISIRNSFTIFDKRYEPMIYSTISFKRQTLAGSIIPRINYSNRLGKHGVQYDVDFYPKFSKRLYAYLNYGYSNASIYPNHKIGGDVYINLPGAIEFSAGGRYISTDTRNISVLTNSLGHYRGNYYFSLRSYITPRPDGLTRISGNFLVRKYLKDGENYFGGIIGMGFSPELRQLTSGDELLAETILYVESQRLSLEYQFTGKKDENIFRTNLGITRQELVFDSGNFVWGVSAGLSCQVKF